MNIKEVKTLPVCDGCGGNARYDLPSRSGVWGYWCRPCALAHTWLPAKQSTPYSLGTEFVLVSSVNNEKVGK